MAEFVDDSNVPDSATIGVIRSLSIVQSLVIVAGLYLQVHHKQCNLCLVHVTVASLFAISGIFISKLSTAKYVYIIAGSLNWYGVFYSFISTESEISWQHFVQPEVVIAFLAYASSLLTIPELNNSKKFLSDPFLNSLALLCLLTYFWVIEVYFVMQSHQFFVDGVMSKMPHRLGSVILFSDHRITYSVILITCHYSNVLLCLAMSYSNEELETAAVDSSCVELREKMERKLLSRNRYKSSTSNGNNQRNEDIDSIHNTEKPHHADIDEEAKNPGEIIIENDGKTKTRKKISHADTELPSDCLEITYEEAVNLGGFFDDTYPRAAKEHSGSA